MKKSKFLSVLLCGAMVATALTACGNNNTETDAPQTSGNESQAESKAEGGKELVYWSMWTANEPQAEVIKEAIAAYEEASGNTVKVEWKGRDIKTLIQAALESNTQIDLFDDDFQRVAQSFSDNTLDLEEMAAAAGYEENANAGLLNAIRGWAGSLKAIPYQPYTSGVFYNTALFDAAGIEGQPETWTEFMDACQKLVDAGYEPLALDDAYVLYNFGFHLARYIGQDGVKELTKNGDWSSNEGAKKAAQDMIDMVNAGYLESGAPAAYPASENQIGLTEEVAMVVNASWVPAEITNNTSCDIEWGMFNYPAVDGGVDANTLANVGAQGFAIPSYSENAQEAFDFIMTLVTGEFDQKMADATDSIPADSRNTWPAMLECCKDAYESLTGVYEWNMGLNENQDISSMLSDNVIKLFEGQFSTADDFLSAMDSLY